MRGAQGILKNLSILSGAQVAAQLLNVVALVYLARVVGSHWFGVLQIGSAFSGYALICAEWGMWALGIREVARLDSPDAVRNYVRVHVGLLAALSLFVLAIGMACLPLFPAFRLDPWIFLVYLILVVPQVFMLDWVGIGLEQMTWVGIVKICRSLFYALLVLLLLTRLDGLAGWPAQRWAPVMFLIGFIVSNRIMTWRLGRWVGAAAVPVWAGWREWRRRLGQAGPIGASNITVRIVLGIDVILLGALADPAIVGSYAAAAKILFVLIVAVEVLWKAFLPRLSRLWADSAGAFRHRFNLYLGLVWAGFVPAAAGGFTVGERLMQQVYGDAFGGAGVVFQILSFSYVLLSLGMFFGNTLIAIDRQQAYFPPLVAAAVAAVLGNLLLVPRHGALGACWAMLISHSLLFVWTTWTCRRLLGPALALPFLTSLLGTAAMVVVIRLLAFWPLAALIAVGAVVYGMAAGPLLWRWSRHQLRGLA
jgi:O-antigen/teichoic acid export membrane protein